MLSINCRSAADKIDDIRQLVYDTQPLMVVLTETWFDGSHPRGTLHINGYNSIRRDRNESFKQKYQKSGGGGIALIYRSDLKVTQITNETDLDMDEAAWFRFKIKSDNYILGILYRPEYVDILGGNPGQLERGLSRAAQLSSRVLLAGDFNINLLEDTTTSRRLVEICESFGLRQQINVPTRVSGHSETLLDHVWSTEDCRLGESGVLPGISDHLITFVEIKSPPKQLDKKLTCRSYKDYNPEAARNLYADEIGKSNFKRLLEQQELDEAVAEWIRVTKDVCDQTAPIKSFMLRKDEDHIPWFDSKINHLKNVRQTLLSIYHKNREPTIKEKIKQITNTLKSTKRRLKREYFTRKISENTKDGKKLWRFLREATNTGEECVEIEPDTVTQQTANNFNTSCKCGQDCSTEAGNT